MLVRVWQPLMYSFFLEYRTVLTTYTYTVIHVFEINYQTSTVWGIQSYSRTRIQVKYGFKAQLITWSKYTDTYSKRPEEIKKSQWTKQECYKQDSGMDISKIIAQLLKYLKTKYRLQQGLNFTQEMHVKIISPDFSLHMAAKFCFPLKPATQWHTCNNMGITKTSVTCNCLQKQFNRNQHWKVHVRYSKVCITPDGPYHQRWSQFL